METVCLGNHAAVQKKQENVDNLRERWRREPVVQV